MDHGICTDVDRGAGGDAFADGASHRLLGALVAPLPTTGPAASGRAADCAPRRGPHVWGRHPEVSLPRPRAARLVRLHALVDDCFPGGRGVGVFPRLEASG